MFLNDSVSYGIRHHATELDIIARLLIRSIPRNITNVIGKLIAPDGLVELIANESGTDGGSRSSSDGAAIV
jgi:hypothetical protein